MAAQAIRERIVKMKREEIDQLKLQITDYVDQLTRNSQSWIDSQGNVGSYQDLNVQLDSAINWLCEIVDKINTAPVLAKFPSHGFTVSMPANGKSVSLSNEQTVTCFTNVTFNPGGHYDPATGTYTVPLTGWYRIKLSHSQSKWATRGCITLQVRRSWKESGESQLQNMFVTNTWGNKCNFGTQGVKLQAANEQVVDLNVGDELYVHVCGAAATRLLAPASFSCELLEE